MATIPILSGESDIFVGRRARLRRYLVCAMEGYFPVLAQLGPDSLAVIYRLGAPHIGILGTVGVATSQDGGRSWSDPVALCPRGRDARNPALGVSRAGRLIAAYWEAALHCYEQGPDGELRWKEKENESWRNVPALMTMGSSDGGRTWSAPRAYKSSLLSLDSPYGRIV
jgi:hypothetical protein